MTKCSEIWLYSCQKSFKTVIELREVEDAITTALILCYFDLSLPCNSIGDGCCRVRSQSSHFWKGIRVPICSTLLLSRPQAHPSRWELRHPGSDRAILAFVDTMDRFRHYFEGPGHQTIIYSDHHKRLTFTRFCTRVGKYVEWRNYPDLISLLSSDQAE